MANSKNIQKQNTKVVAYLKDAVSASGTMLECCKNAARAAAPSVDKALPLKDAIDKVAALYSDIIGTDNNVRANFKDALLLYVAGTRPVSIVNRKGEEVHTTAEEAVSLGKHDMKKAVKEVREELGIGRAAGGGRKPQQPTKPTKVVEGTKQPEKLSADGLALIVASRIEDKKFFEALQARLETAGYTITKS